MFKEEYSAIYDTVTPDMKLLSDTLALNGKKIKQKPKKVYRFITIPIGVLASLMVVFILTVNLSPVFAHALEQIPVLNKLAAILTFSPELKEYVNYSHSLSAAVNNDYLQHIGQKQTSMGITINIKYVIVDQKQLHIFYTLESEIYEMMFLSDIELLNADGLPAGEYIIFTSNSKIGYLSGEIQQDSLRHVFFDFINSDIPDDIIIKCSVRDSYESEYVPNEEQTTAFTNIFSPVPITSFSIPISIDLGLIQQTETIEINRELFIDGQNIIIASVDINPTHTRVNIIENEENTAKLQSMYLYLIDENNNRIEPTGYSNDQWVDSGTSTNYYLESYFFSEYSNLTLVITDVIWLNKNAKLTRINLLSGEAENLPPGVKLIESIRRDNDWALIFSAPNKEQKYFDQHFIEMNRQTYNLFDKVFYDRDSNSYSFAISMIRPESYELYRFYNEYYTEEDYYVREIWEIVETPGFFGTTRIIKDYSQNIAYLQPSFTHISVLDIPIEITVR